MKKADQALNLHDGFKGWRLFNSNSFIIISIAVILGCDRNMPSFDFILFHALVLLIFNNLIQGLMPNHSDNLY